MHETIGCFEQKKKANKRKIKKQNYYDNKEMQCNDNDVDESIVVDHSGNVRNESHRFSDFNIGKGKKRTFSLRAFTHVKQLINLKFKFNDFITVTE